MLRRGQDLPGQRARTFAQRQSGRLRHRRSGRRYPAPDRSASGGEAAWSLRFDLARHWTAETPLPDPRGRAVGTAPLRLRSLALSAEGRNRCLPVSFGHLDIASSVIGEVRVVFLVPPAQGNRRKLGAPHVRLQLLKG